MEALTLSETKAILEMLKNGNTALEKENYAIFYILVTSGLRASELLQLRWGDVEMVEGSLYCKFVGKGNRLQKQELYPPAFEATKKYFDRAFHRKPRARDWLFWDAYQRGKLEYNPLYFRIRGIGIKAKNKGILKRDIAVSPHLLRRTYATLLYKSGMKVKSLQQKTRHKSINVLLEHYIDDQEPASPIFNKILQM